MSVPNSAGEPLNPANSSALEKPAQENWWDYCPICNGKLQSHKCKYVCSNPRCNFFMSCSEFDR
jgi:hypothetical protein